MTSANKHTYHTNIAKLRLSVYYCAHAFATINIATTSTLPYVSVLISLKDCCGVNGAGVGLATGVLFVELSSAMDASAAAP